MKILSTSPPTIQKDLDILADWCDTWQMKTAPSKCEVINFSKGRNNKPYNQISLMLKSSKLPTTKHIRDLGILLTNDLSFNLHITTIVRRCHQRMNILFNILKNSNLEVMVKCFKIYIRPIAEYASTIFSPILKSDCTRLESLQKSFVYRCSKVFQFNYEGYFKALEHCVLESLEYRRLLSDLTVMYKILITKEFYNPDNIHTFLFEGKSLRRHPFYLRSALSNKTKPGAQYLSNRAIRCWNSLPPNIFPVKLSSRCFQENIKLLDLNKFLTLNSTNF